MVSESFCFSCCAPETGTDMSMYDIAKIVGYCTNDHAESMVKNEFAPGLQRVLEAANGTEAEVIAVQLCLRHPSKRAGHQLCARCPPGHRADDHHPGRTDEGAVRWNSEEARSRKP